MSASRQSDRFSEVVVENKDKHETSFIDGRDVVDYLRYSVSFHMECWQTLLRYFFRYWEIPFDPFREYVLTDHTIFKIEKSESENEQDVSLSKVGFIRFFPNNLSISVIDIVGIFK